MALKILLTVNSAWLDQPLFLVVAGREKLPVFVEEIDIPSGGGSPAGPFASVQFNNGGTFGGDDRFLYAPGSGQPAVYAALPSDAPGWFVVDETNATAAALRRALGVVELVSTGYELLLRSEDETGAKGVELRAGAELAPGATGPTATLSGGIGPGEGGAAIAKGGAGGSIGGAFFGEGGTGPTGGDAHTEGGQGTGVRGGYGRIGGGNQGPNTGAQVEASGATTTAGGDAIVRLGTGSGGPTTNGRFRVRYRGAAADFFGLQGGAVPPGTYGAWLKQIAPGDPLFFMFEAQASPTPLGYLAWTGSFVELQSSAGLRLTSSGSSADWPAANAPGALINDGFGGLSWSPVSGSPGGPQWSVQFQNPIGSFAGSPALQFNNPALLAANQQLSLKAQAALESTRFVCENNASATANCSFGWTGTACEINGGSVAAIEIRSFGNLSRWPTSSPGLGQALEMSAANVSQIVFAPPSAYKVRIASTANLALSGLAAIDGATPSAGDLILAKNQTTATDNGIYVAAAGAWARWAGYNNDGQIRGRLIVVTDGTTNRGSSWANTNTATITVGATNLTYAFTNASTTAGAAVNGAAGVVGTGSTAARADHTHQVTGGSFGGTALTFNAVTDGQVLQRSGTTVIGATPGLGTPSLGAVVTSVNVTALPSSAAYTQLMNLAISPPTAGTYLIEGMIPIRSETAYGETFDVQLACTGATTFTTKVATKGGYFFASAGSPNNYEDQIYFRLSVALNAGANNIGIQIRQQNAGGTSRTINPQGFQYSAAAQRQ